MEATESQVQPAVEAERQDVSPPASAQPEQPAARSNGRPFSFAKAMGMAVAPERPASTPDDADAEDDDDESDDDKSGAPAPSKPSPDKPGQAAKTPGSRRSQEAAANLARIAELEAAQAKHAEEIAAAREQARAEALEVAEREKQAAEQQAATAALARTNAEDAAKYQRLLRTPDNAMSPEDYLWREQWKEKLDLFPEVEKFQREQAVQYVANERTRIAAEAAALKQAHTDGIVAQLLAAEALPGVDHEALSPRAEKPLDTWDKIAAYYHATGASWKESEVRGELQPKLDAALEKIERQAAEIHDLKLVGPRGLGATRRPTTGGDSAASRAGQSGFDPSRSARENLSAAIASGAGRA